MSYIKFSKEQLVNLKYSLSRELIRSNRAGSFSSTTIAGCNTRKYHGLLIVPQPAVDNECHVLLSSVDETVIQNEAEFNLGLHQYASGVFHPKGHKYLREFIAEPIPKLTYRVGGVIFTKEMLFSIEEDRILIKYTLVEAHSATTLRFKPFLAFRSRHSLTKANVDADTHYEPSQNGIRVRMYQGFTPVFMQFSKNAEYIHVPHWNYNVEYNEERERGYDFTEDLFVPGYFELPMKKGESVIFAAGTKETSPASLKRIFITEEKRRIPRDSFRNCLVNSAHQCLVFNGKKVEVIAGFPWFGRWGRDTFIALPGLTLATDDAATCKKVIDTMIADLQGPLFPNVGSGTAAAYNSVDAPLWFFWALQKYAEHTATGDKVWKDYGKKMQIILNGYRNGTDFNIKMQEDGLVYAGIPCKALTWMDAVVHGKPVTPRIGMPVEINALWYNAVMFALESASMAGDTAFVNEWSGIAMRIPVSFKATFWDKDKGYLADYVNGDYKDWAVRPNMIFAASLPYSPVSEQIRKLILDTVGRELLTKRGLRTLTPKHPDYKGCYYGSMEERDHAYHQGTVWPWLLGHYAEAFLKIHGVSGAHCIRKIYEGFEEVMTEHGIGSISEVYDGDPPHKAGGAPSQAWSVAELLRIDFMLKQYESPEKKPAAKKPVKKK